jgi:hypothetical protein
MRKDATTDFAKDYFKLKNNSLYGEYFHISYPLGITPIPFAQQFNGKLMLLIELYFLPTFL